MSKASSQQSSPRDEDDEGEERGVPRDDAAAHAGDSSCDYGGQRERPPRDSTAAAAGARRSAAAGDKKFSEFLLQQLREAEKGQDLAQSAELRTRLLSFARQERSNADTQRLLRSVRPSSAHSRTGAGTGQQQALAFKNRAGAAWGDEEREMAQETSRVVSKARDAASK